MYDLVTVDFGVNLDKFNPTTIDLWRAKVEEFRQAVEEHGEARASWSCMGRTRHQLHSNQLASELPQFKFDIRYDSYWCTAKKK